MKDLENLIKQHLKTTGNTEKTANCPSEKVLSDYLEHKLSGHEEGVLEEHISHCGFCLSQISLAYEAQKEKIIPKVPAQLIEKVKNFIAADKAGISAKMAKKRKIKKNLFLAATLIFFVLSFLIHKYFMQFLFAGLIVGFRWALESENARTLIMVIDSWRKHAHNDDEEIEKRLKDRFSKRDL